MLPSNRAGIDEAGLRFGAYHFGGGSDGGAQANFFLSVLAPRPGDLLALDCESNPTGPSVTMEEARSFVTAVNHSTGVWPVLYGDHCLKEMLPGGGEVLSICPLWLAQFGPAAVISPAWSSWSLWQYSHGAIPAPSTVPGIGHCNRDRASGDLTGLAAFWQSASSN